LESEQVIPISAKKGQGFDRLFLAIVKSEPRIVAALGAALPDYRLNLAQATIAKATSTAAAIAATPLPFLDFFPLIGIQTSMVLGIARIYAYRITFARARELIGTFGIGLLGRTLFYELSKFSGPPGWLVAAGVAAGTTYALGHAAVAWFDRGENLSKDAVQRLSRGIGQNMIERMRSLGRRRPKREAVSQKVSDVLEELPILDQEDGSGD
jgi:GTP-binding protein Era